MKIGEELIRKCNTCGTPMTEGYWIEGDEYYCTEECLHKEVSEEHFKELCDLDYAYWTDWKGQELRYKHDWATSVLTIYTLDGYIFSGEVELGLSFTFQYEGKDYTCEFNEDDTIDLIHGTTILDTIEKQ